jgi:glycosyltransferase involved in cell wall biosynthesis
MSEPDHPVEIPPLPEARPWLSVIMPVYNGERYLRAALESVAREAAMTSGQLPMEIIAVDDGSTDASPAILEEFRDRLSLKVIRQAASGSWVGATNAGIRLATGHYIGFLHQDDLWLPGRLPALRNLVDAFPEAGWYFHAVTYIDEAGSTRGRLQAPLRRGRHEPHRLLAKLLVQNFVSIPSPIIRRDVVQRAGELDPRLWYTADWDYWLRLGAMGSVAYDPHPWAAFRIHSGSQTICRSSGPDDFRRQLETVYEAHAAQLSSRPDLFGDTNILKQVDRAARFSIELNTSLAGAYHQRPLPLWRLVTKFVSLGPVGSWRFLRDSRIIERISARWRWKRS